MRIWVPEYQTHLDSSRMCLTFCNWDFSLSPWKRAIWKYNLITWSQMTDTKWETHATTIRCVSHLASDISDSINAQLKNRRKGVERETRPLGNFSRRKWNKFDQPRMCRTHSRLVERVSLLATDISDHVIETPKLKKFLFSWSQIFVAEFEIHWVFADCVSH